MGYIGQTPSAVPLTSADIVDGTITNDDLAGSITDAKISALAASKLTGVVAPANLGTGTASASTFLNGAGAYAEAGGGAWSVASSGSFSSATELELSIGTKTTQIILSDINIDANGGQRMYAQISFDGGSTYKSDSTYRYAQRYTVDGDGSVADSYQLNAGTDSVMRLSIGDMGDASVDASMVRFTVYNPANTSSNKIFETYAVESDSTDSDVAISFGMGMYEGAQTAINGIKLYPHDSPTRSMTGNYIVLELN
jgi:hypothetical protein